MRGCSPKLRVWNGLREEDLTSAPVYVKPQTVSSVDTERGENSQYLLEFVSVRTPYLLRKVNCDERNDDCIALYHPVQDEGVQGTSALFFSLRLE